MSNKNIATVQLVVAIVAVVYVLMPDLFVGPLDDAAIATIAVIAETVMGVVRAVTKKESNLISDNGEEVF